MRHRGQIKAFYSLALLAILGSVGCGVTGASGVNTAGETGFLPPLTALRGTNPQTPIIC